MSKGSITPSIISWIYIVYESWSNRSKNSFIALFAALGIILGAIYMLYLYKKIIFGTLENEKLKEILDLNLREKLILYPLVLAVFIIGIIVID